MEEVEFVNPNFIVTQKINQIGKVLNEIKEKQAEILLNNQFNGINYNNNNPGADQVKLGLIKQQAAGDSNNFTQQIKILQEENKNRTLFLKKPIITDNYQPEQEKKFKNIPPQQQLLKLENTYKDLYFGSDTLQECLKGDDEILPLIKRRSNGSVLIQKNSSSYEYIFTNYTTNCLSGIQFGLESNLLTNHYNINVKKQIEYNPIKKVSSILGLNKITIYEQEYLQVRSIYNIHHLKINEKGDINFKGVEHSQYQDENGNYKEVLDCIQNNFFEEEQYILGEGNYIFKQINFDEISQQSQLKSLKSNVESLDVSYHPYSIYLQMTDSVALYDTRNKEPNVILKVPTKKVPMHRIYGFKNLEENYFMVSTTQHFKIYDIRCTNYPVYSVSHGSDECPPTIINIYNDNEQNEEDNDIMDTFLHDESIDLIHERGSSRREKIITCYSPHKNGDILFMRWCKGSTLLEPLYENKKNQKKSSNQSHHIKSNKNKDYVFQNQNQLNKSEQSLENSNQEDTIQNENDFNFKFLSKINNSKNKKNNNKSEKNKRVLGFNESQSHEQSQSENKDLYNNEDENNDGQSLNDSDNGEQDKSLQKHQVIGRETKGERLCFNQEVKNLFQPKGILSSTQISDSLKVRGVCVSFFEEQNKFMALQNDSKGGVALQVFCRKNDQNPQTSSFIPLNAVSSSTTPILDIDKNDSKLSSIIDLQIMKLFERPDYTDKNTINEDLITEPVRLRKQKKKQVNMFPYFNYLRDQVDNVKTENLDEINKFIDQQPKKKQINHQAQLQSTKDNIFNSQNINEENNPTIKEIIMEQNNLLSVYHDRLSYPEFRQNMKYNNKNIMTQKITEVLEEYWD